MTGRLRTLLARRASRARWGYVPALPALAALLALTLAALMIVPLFTAIL